MNEKDRILLQNIDRRFTDNGRGKVRDALMQVFEEALATPEQRQKTMEGFKSTSDVEAISKYMKSEFPNMNEGAFKIAFQEIKEGIGKEGGF